MDKEALDLVEITHHYSILGAQLRASKEELRRARNKMLHQFHPDRQASGWTCDDEDPAKRAYLIQSAYLYIIEHYDDIKQMLSFLNDASLTNRMPLKARSHWIYTTIASCDNKEDS